MENPGTLILMLLPVILVELSLKVFALIDLIRRDKAEIRGNSKWVWVFIILLINLIGPILYLAAGRLEDNSGKHSA